MGTGINHRLFGNNKSTATHWYPSGNRPAIAISHLHIHHVAAIIDQYEGEAVKFINENVNRAPHTLSESSRRSSPLVQRFLETNVPAWGALKWRETRCSRINPTLYNKLFVRKEYRTNTKSFQGKTLLDSLIGRVIPVEIPKSAGNQEEPTNKTEPILNKTEFSKLSDYKKAQLQLNVVKARVSINNAITDLAVWIDKNL